MIPLGILGNRRGGGAAAGAYELISSQILTGTAASVTFSSIPSTYKHLQVRAVTRGGLAANEITSLCFRFNSDATNNYRGHRLNANSAGIVSGTYALGAYISTPSSVPLASTTANIWGSSITDILDYSSTSKYKTIRFIGGAIVNATTSSLNAIGLSSGFCLGNTNAISSLTILEGTESGGFVAGSRFSLYGIKG